MTVSLAAPRRSVFIALGIVVGTTMAASVSALAQGAPEPVEPEVIAESVVPFPDGTYYWSTADTRIDAGAELVASAPRPTSFVLVESGEVTIDSGAEPVVIGIGEAAFDDGAVERLITTDPTATAEIREFAILGGEPAVDDPLAVGKAFTLDAGEREVSLLSAELPAGEATTIPGTEGVPLLLTATAGAVTVSSDAEDVELAPGDAGAFSGDVTIVNSSEQISTVTAAVIGEPIEPPADTSTTRPSTPASASSTVAPTTTQAPVATTTAPTAPTTTPPATTETTTAPPTADAIDDSVTAPQNTSIQIDVLANDIGTGLEVTNTTDPPNGFSSAPTDGVVTYLPNQGFSGIDSFQYTITDANGNTDTATVTVTVTAPERPEANDDSFTVPNTFGLSFSVLANDFGVGIEITGVTQPASGGTASVNAGRVIDYAPPAGFLGTDTFTYTITDDDGQTDSGTVTVDVTV